VTEVATANGNESSTLTPEQRQTLWEQFVEVYSDEQKAFDNSVRTLAAAGIGVTVTLATALKSMPAAGNCAAVCFVASLGLNLASHVTSQLDMRSRLACLRDGRDEGYERSRWTMATTLANIAAGLAFIAGSVLLAVFVSGSI
jgi:hypothetical protein